MTSLTHHAPAASGAISTRRAIRVAAATYVTAWVAGLAVAPAAPDPLTATSAQLADHAATNTAALLTQSSLVHGLAGLALLALALLLPRHLPPGRAIRLARTAGIVAAAASLAQTGLMVRLLSGASDDTASTTAGWFGAIDRVDSLKLLALAGAIGLFTAAIRDTPHRWLVRYGTVLAGLLPSSGAAFLGVDALYPLLYLTLPMLLVWIPWFSVAVTRPANGIGRSRR